MAIAGGVSGSFTPQAVELATVLVDQAATALALVRARAEAGTDAITGCMNHRSMRRRLDEEIGRAQRGGSPLSCLLIDLDNFKLVNDRHGHPAGDAMLRDVVQALVGEFRAFDRVARYGGDEFVVILPNADLESAAAAATRALERLRELPILADTSPGVSASIGVAQWQPRMTTDAAARGLRRSAAALQAPGQGARHEGLRAQPLSRRSALRATFEGPGGAPLRDWRQSSLSRADPSGAAMSQNSFGAKDTLDVGGQQYEIFRLDALQQRFDVARLPFSLKVLLENLLRTEGNGSVDAADIEALASWDAKAAAEQGDRLLTGARADAGLHGRARRRRSRRDARRDGRHGRRSGEDQPARARRARHRPLGPGGRVRHARRLPRQRRARVRAQP